MQKFWVLLIFIVLPAQVLFSQRIEVVPYPDAIAASSNGGEKVYLSNTDSKILMEYFVAEFSPDKIIPVKEGYFRGYRLCFTGGDNSPESESSDWIQVLTIDVDAALSWFQENTPEILEFPFLGLKTCVGKNGHKKSDYKEVLYKYRHLPCKMYCNVIGPDGLETDELSASLQQVKLKGEMHTENLYASLSSGIVSFDKLNVDKHPQADPWTDWINCFDDLLNKGYISLIEFNEPVITPF